MSAFDSERFAARESVLNTVLGAALGTALVNELGADAKTPPLRTIALGALGFLCAAVLMFYAVFAARRLGRQVAERIKLSSYLIVGYLAFAAALTCVPGIIRGLSWREFNVPLLYILTAWLPLYLLVGWYSRSPRGEGKRGRV